MTVVVFVCSPFNVATAKGSGKPTSRQRQPSIREGSHTEDITLVETIGGNDCMIISIRLRRREAEFGILVSRRLGCLSMASVSWNRGRGVVSVATYAGRLESILVATMVK